MKRSFAFDLKPGEILLPFMIYWLTYFLYQYYQLFSAPLRGNPDPGAVVTISLIAILMLVYAIIVPIICRKVIPAVSFEGSPLSFKGTVGRFIVVCFLGFLLSMITLGIYFPWYCRNIMNYFANNTEHKGTAFSFGGKAGRLFLIYAGMLLITFTVAFGIGMLAIAANSSSGVASAGDPSLSIVWVVLVFVAVIPFMYLIYKWMVNFAYAGSVVVWKTEFWPSCWIILKEWFLTGITIGIYFPIAAIHLLSYFGERTVVMKEENETGHFVFSAPAGKGFVLIWGQTLLSIITLGFYLPWAWARMGKWMAEHLFLESPAVDQRG